MRVLLEGSHCPRLTFVVSGLSAAARCSAKIILRLNSDEGGGSGGAGGAVSMMIQATSEAKQFLLVVLGRFSWASVLLNEESESAAAILKTEKF